VPQDVAIVGFDGLPETAYYWPPLTTVYQDQQLLGRTAVQALIGVIESEQGSDMTQHQAILLQPELIVRASSARPA
jgi:DNA-binding LacI/PurR family transcriptional regulator